MPVTAIVGTQWGDEGKGRIVDYLAQRADVTIRFQGGDNAGHTVVNDFGTFALHMVPSGIFNPATRCIIGTGCVVNPDNLLVELDKVEAAGVSTANLWISSRSHLVLPYHPMLDSLEESARQGDTRIGTTKRGIGPTYADKAARWGLRVGDILRPDYFRQRLENALQRKRRLFEEYNAQPPSIDALVERAEMWRQKLGHRIIDTVPVVRKAIENDERVILEGQLGIMRDLDWGTYPYVTSSNPTAAAASSGVGMPSTSLKYIVGVVKAYCTAVGAGPFPVEALDEHGERLQQIGKEFGATTGRKRRCGWFDGVAINYAAWLNGLTGLAVTKLDVLDTFEELKVCVGYQWGDQVLTHVPDTPTYEEVTPIYETWKGWQCSTCDARTWDDLPAEAQAYLLRLSELAGVPIQFVSVGPERDELIVL
jgi:adenylosuccinate synthase